MNNCKYLTRLLTAFALSLSLLIGLFSFSSTSQHKSSQPCTQSEQLISSKASKKRCVPFPGIALASVTQPALHQNHFTYSLLNFDKNIDVQLRQNHVRILWFRTPNTIIPYRSLSYGHDEDLPASSLA